MTSTGHTSTFFPLSLLQFLAYTSRPILFYWVFFLIHSALTFPKKDIRPTPLRCALLLLHTWPVFVLQYASKTASAHKDPRLVFFVTLLFFRYYKIIVLAVFWCLYHPGVTKAENPHKGNEGKRGSTAEKCTVIVATVGPVEGKLGHDSFRKMVCGILSNHPRRLIFSTSTKAAAQAVQAILPEILSGLPNPSPSSQPPPTLPETKPTKKSPEITYTTTYGSTEILVLNAKKTNKREQAISTLPYIETQIIASADDSVIWPATFLNATLPAFADPYVSLVGTRKWVTRRTYAWDYSLSYFQNACRKYMHGFWNTVGALYLVRQNFELRGSNTADGGVFCVSGRTYLIRKRMLADPDFQAGFLNESVYGLGSWSEKLGPLIADDDNFVTRWAITHGHRIKMIMSDEATITTSLGVYPKFVQQCCRWSRTTIRQNPVALFADHAIWWVWPVSVWTTYIPWLFNPALFWDPFMVYSLMQTKLYKESERKGAMLACFIACVWASKLLKTIPWWRVHRRDFLLYFFPIPAAPLFSYVHSLIKFYTWATVHDISWSGRKLEENSKDLEKPNTM